MTAVALARVSDRLSPLRGAFREGRFVARATCGHCGSYDEWSAMSMPQPEVVKKKMARRGWSISRSATCPACIANKEKDVAIKPAQAPSPAIVALNKLIRLALDEAYDDDNLRYRPGHSDETVAKAVGGGCPTPSVAALRERAYGPPGEPDEVAALRSALDEATSELGKLRSRFDSMCSKNGFKQ